MVYIIIPNYNGRHHLESCLPSLKSQNYADYEVIVVDNGSDDESPEYVRENYPDIKVITLEQNEGFSRAVNVGIKSALQNPDASHIVLLNNDIECDSNFLMELLNGFPSVDVGSVCPKMLDFYSRDVIDDAGDIVSKKRFPTMRGRGEKDIGQYNNSEFVFGACAGAAMYKREVFESVGYFDEDYFAFLEDVDLNFRLQYSGFKCVYVPRAICYHKRGGTISANKMQHIYLLERNIVALRIKNYPLSILLGYSMFYLVHRIYRFMIYLFSKQPSLFVGALKGYAVGVLLIPKWIAKRRRIMSKRKVEVKRIIDLMK